MSLQAQQFAGGTGTQGDPYLVATADHLNNVRQFPSAHYRQTADISLSGYQSGEGWVPIFGFTGFYDGGGFTISGLVINRPGSITVGLFGFTSGVTLTRIRLSNPRISAKDNAGSLAGTVVSGSISDVVVTGAELILSKDGKHGGGLIGSINTSSVTRSYSRKGSVHGEWMIGGLVGYSLNTSITDSYSSGMTITASSNAGGLAGATSGSSSIISNSYSTNKVISSWAGGLVGISTGGTISTTYATSVVTGTNVGGLIGVNSGTSISNSYFNSDSTANSAGGTALTTAQMRQQSSFTGFDFDYKWFIDEERSFPELQFYASLNPAALFAGGSGTLVDPYRLTTAGQLHNVRLVPGAHFLQTANIDLGVTPYNTGEGWFPITNLKGSYDGGGYKISNLVINRAATDSVGLFKKISGATLTRITLTNALVTGRDYVGGLVGSSSNSSLSDIRVTGANVTTNTENAGAVVGTAVGGSITRTRVNGAIISGAGNIGGLVGAIHPAITLSESVVIGGSVTGTTSRVGGLAGSSNGTISNSYTKTTVVGGTDSSYGGLVGFNSGVVFNNYSVSVVTGNSAAGLVGLNSGGTITNSYFNSDSTANGNGNGTAVTTTRMRQLASFAGWDFGSTWFVYEGSSFPELRFFTDPDPAALFAGGSGTLVDPYRLATAGQLHNVRLAPGAHFLQTSNIDLGVAPHNTGEGWFPIANFTGTYNGDSYTISNLLINRPASDSVGLFGEVKGGKISNLSLTGASVTGNRNVGVLAGSVSDTSAISQVHLSNLTVTGSNNAGGLAGELTSGSTLSNSFTFKGSVRGSGSGVIGGLVGFARNATITSVYSSGIEIALGNGPGGLVGVARASSISDCYTYNRVIGDVSGGLIGISLEGSVTNCYSASVASGVNTSGITGLINPSFPTSYSNVYYNSDSTGTSVVGVGLSTTQARQQASFTGFNFETTWIMFYEGDLFPGLRAFFSINTLFAGGKGTQTNPFQIATADQLNNIRLFPAAHYRQTADIDLGVAPYNTGEGWLPIPNFSASYDGDGFTISNLFINRGSTNDVGLFGSVNGGRVENIILSSPSVTGQNNAGALLGATGSSAASISRIQITGGSVSGVSFVGGMVGDLTNGSIAQVRVNGTKVSGGTGVGGLVGIIAPGTMVSESYVIGGVLDATQNVIGGLIGINRGSITNSYTNTRVRGAAGSSGNTSGGLVGFISLEGSISNSYSASVVTGNQVAGVVGTILGAISNSYYNSDSTTSDNAIGTALTTVQMRQQASFTGFDFDSTWAILNEGGAFPKLQTLLDASTLFAGGSGTLADPYQVATDVQLNSVRFFSNLHYRQTNNIDLIAYQSGEGWLPIPGFGGTYDGKGHRISNLFINRPSTNEVGLFGSVDGGRVENMILNNPSVTGQNNVGALVGATGASATSISDIRITGGSVSGTNFIGGMVGQGGGAITYSYATGMSVTGFVVVGGLVGSGSGLTNSIANSYTINTVQGSTATGGLAGISNTITNSYSASKVTATIAGAEGLVSTSGGSITNSYYNSDSAAVGIGNGTALTTAQMRQRSSFPSFDFASTWFIDEGVGFPGFQERKENELILTGTQGWRMLASPLETHSIGTLFNDLWLQGFPGADTTGGTPNLYVWNEASRSWTVPADTTFVPGKGTGFLVYLYSDDDNDGSPEGFPKKLSHTGMGFSGDHGIDLSYNNTGSVANDGWNLVGNPYPSSIHWNAVQGWTRSNIDATVYIWDASANNGNGAYVSWNTLGVGTKGDGRIAPWQGFWVKTHALNPRIVFSDRVKSSGGRLLKQGKQPDQQLPQLTLELEGNGQSSESVVLFHEQAEVGKDPLDAYKLRSLNKEDFLLLGTSADGQQVMDIQALPVSGGPSELELVMEGSNLDGEFTLSWSSEHLPEGWSAELVDTKTDEFFPLAKAGSHTFSLRGAKAKTGEKGKDLGRPVSPITPLLKLKVGPSRFVIRFSQAVSGEIDPELPQVVALQQNYPNPFNPATTINYQVPKQSRVRLEVFDMLGRNVATLINERVEAGYHQVRFDARNLASGMYIYRLQAGDKTVTKKLTLIK